MPSDDVIEKLLLNGVKHLQLNVLFIAFHQYVNCDYCHCSLIKPNSNALAQPTVLHLYIYIYIYIYIHGSVHRESNLIIFQ